MDVIGRADGEELLQRAGESHRRHRLEATWARSGVRARVRARARASEYRRHRLETTESFDR